MTVIEEIKDEQKVDLLHIFRVILDNKKTFVIPCVIATILGVVISLGTPNYYKTEVILAPEVGGSGSLTDNLSDLASMVGVNLTSSSNSIDAIYPEIYPQILKSTPFITDLFTAKVTTKDNKIKDVTYYDYLVKYAKKSWLDAIIDAILPDKKKEEKITVDNFELTEEQDNIRKAIIQNVQCNVDKKTSIISISVTADDAKVSAEIADIIQRKLQDYVIKYRTTKARNDVEYAEKLLKDIEKQYHITQDRSAAYSDGHFNSVLAAVKSRQTRLDNEAQIKYLEYNQVVQQLAGAKAKLQEKTPAFTQIQPASIPLKKAGPKRSIIVIGFILAAFALTSIWLVAKDARK